MTSTALAGKVKCKGRSMYIFGRRLRAEPEQSTHSASRRSDDFSDSRMTKHCNMLKLFTRHSISSKNTFAKSFRNKSLAKGRVVTCLKSCDR